MKKSYIFIFSIFIHLLSAYSQQSFGFSNFGRDSTLTQKSHGVSEIALDQKIDPNKYTVGVGDQLLVSLIGGITVTHNLIVMPEGFVLLPDYGLVKVAGLSLTEVKEKIQAIIRQNILKNGRIFATLLKPRGIKVVIARNFSPEEKIVTSINRVSEVLPIYDDDRYKNMSLRNIKVFRKNDKLTDTLDVDLLTFYRLGKKDPFNPYLVEGDVIFVPPMKRNIDKIEVYGAVKSPLIYEYKKGDRLKDAIEMCYGFTDDADRTKIKITRFIDRLVTENLEVNYQLDGNMELASDDRIFVPRINNYHEKHHVTVEGEVLFPGVYPISEGITLLSFVLKQAGGFTDKSDLINAKVIRYQGEDRIDYEFQRIKAMIAVGSQLNEEEEEYFKLKSRQEPGLLAIDFRNVLEEGHSKQDILLKDNDRIKVPKISKTVTIIGAVIKPGIVEHVPGMDYSFYIEKSLGFTNKARTGRIQIIKQISGLWLDADTDIKIEVGDKIFVPEEPIRDYWEITKDIITVVSQVAAIFAIVWSVSR